MRFSVIVPIYNAEKYLSECIDSILSQSFDDFELVLVNDGSVDGSFDICETYSKKDSRVKVIHQTNGGVVSARKTGILNSIGEYIVSVDSDDYISLNLLENLDATIHKYNCDLVAFDAVVFDETRRYKLKNHIKPGFYKSEIQIVKDKFMYDDSIGQLNFGNLLFSLWSKAIRRDLVKKYQLVVPNEVVKGDDLAVLAPIIYECQSIVVLDENLYFYRINEASIMHSYSKKKFESNLVLWEYLYQYCHRQYKKNYYMCILNMTLEHLIGLINTGASCKCFINDSKTILVDSVIKYINEIDSHGLCTRDRLKIYGLKNNLIFFYTIYYIKYKISSIIQ